MTKYEQVVVFLVLFGLGSWFVVWALDVTLARIDARILRNRTWREIDRRCAMQRHPSWQVSVFDQDNP
jgi:type IV secretory pathway TrbD component